MLKMVVEGVKKKTLGLEKNMVFLSWKTLDINKVISF